MLYSKRIEAFFKKELVEFVIFILISTSIVIAITSIVIQNEILEKLNLIFCIVFSIELFLRFFSVKNKKEYFLNYLIDWIAVIPWELFFTNVQGINLAYMRLLRLPRLIRILRFFTIFRSTIGEKFTYFMKNQIEKSFTKQIIMLLVFITSLVLFFGSIFTIMGINFEQGNPFWFSILTVFGPDSLYTIQNESYTIKIISLMLTIIGIIIFNGILIAIIVSKIQQFLDSIKEGRGKVFEENHLIILGYNNLVQYIFNELEIYCKTEKDRIKVVILTNTPLQDIRDMADKYKFVDVILRAGLSYNLTTLKDLCIDKARGVIVFCDNSIKNSSSSYIHDSSVIKSYTTIYSYFNSGNNKKMPPIISNFMDYNNSKYIKYFKDKESVFFNNNYFSGKFFSLLCTNPTFYSIFQELLSYDGNEFHFYSNKKLCGKRFEDVIRCYNNSIPVGIVRDKECIMLPKKDMEVIDGDLIISLALNYKSIDINYSYQLSDPILIHINRSINENQIKKMAIIGLNNRLPFILEELSKTKIKLDILSSANSNFFEEWLKKNCEGMTFNKKSLLSE